MSEWKPVPEWEGLYEVSNEGRVRSVERQIPKRSAYYLTKKVVKHSVILSPYLDHKDRPTVILYNGKQRVHRRVEDLVHAAFGEQHG